MNLLLEKYLRFFPIINDSKKRAYGHWTDSNCMPSLRIRGFWIDFVYLNHRIGNIIIWRYTKYLPKCALCDISWPLRLYSSVWKISVFHNELALINSFDKITILFKKLQNLLQDKNKSNLVRPLRSYFILWKTEKLCLLMLVLNLKCRKLMRRVD